MNCFGVLHLEFLQDLIYVHILVYHNETSRLIFIPVNMIKHFDKHKHNHTTIKDLDNIKNIRIYVFHLIRETDLCPQKNRKKFN